MDIEKLQLKLKKGNPKQRYEAVGELVKLEQVEVLPILTEAKNSEKHEKVLERLNKGIEYLNKKFNPDHQLCDTKKSLTDSQIFGSNISVPKHALDLSESSVVKVKQALESGDEANETKAMRFILKNCATTIVPHLIDIALDRSEKQFTIKTLEVIRLLERPEFCDEIIDFLKSSDVEIISAVLHAQEGIGRLEDMISFLREFSQSDDEDLVNVSEIYLKKLVSTGNTEATEICDELSRMREQKAKEDAFVPFVPEGMEDLLPKKMTDAIEEKKQEESAKKHKAALAYKYRAQIDSKDPKQRIDAMFQLAKANDPEAIELITQLLANESDFKVIASGLSALAQMKAQAALAAIQNFLSHEDSRVRANAVSSIDLILGDDNPKPMLERMLKDPNHRVRANAISALLLSKPKECFLPLYTLANSTSKDENVAAIVIIERFQQDTHLTMLEKFVHSEDSRVVEKAKSVLENWQGDIELSRYILSGGDNFQEFYSKHLENKRREMNRQEENQESGDERSQEPDSDSSEESSDDEGLISGLLKKFRF